MGKRRAALAPILLHQGMQPRQHPKLPPRLLRAAALVTLGALMCAAAGCSFLPFAFFTTASVVMPQNTSLAMSGVRGVYTTASIASDERDVNTMMRDNVLTFKAQSALMTAHAGDGVQVRAYNGELFAVGVVDTQADRDRVILAMQNVKGVGDVKGYIRLRDTEAPMNRMGDDALAMRARLALGRHILHKNAGVDIQAVDGQLCLMGVVGTHAEALDLIQYVESVTGKPALSLLSIHEEYATGRQQTNRVYLLRPDDDTVLSAEMRLREPNPLSNAPVRPEREAAFAEAPDAPTATVASAAAPARDYAAEAPAGGSNGPVYRAAVTPPPRLTPIMKAPAIAPARIAEARPAMPRIAAASAGSARAHASRRLEAMAHAERNPLARAELLALAGKIATDRELSISDRLSVAADMATQAEARNKIQDMLAQY